MRLLFAGDYAPVGRIKELFEEDISYNPLDCFSELVQHVDYAIVNLEAPIGIGEGIKKSGPHLSATRNSISILKDTGFSCCTLANNHIRDYGDEGIINTINTLKELGLDYVGAGQDISSAQSVLYKTIAGERIAIVNVCESEFSIATRNTSGAAPLDVVNTSLVIREAKMHSNYVFVIVHGGHEHFQYPSPRMVSTYRFFVEMGANAVINHHQHCYSGYEWYKGAPIFYGLGNFCFDHPHKKNNTWNYGYLVELIVNNDRIEFELHPYSQCNQITAVKLLNEDETEHFYNTINRISSVIAIPELLEKRFLSFIRETKSNSVISLFTPYLTSYARIAAGHAILPKLLPRSKARAILNYINCESHRDETILVLKEFLRG